MSSIFSTYWREFDEPCSKNGIKNRCNSLNYSDLGGMWGSNPRHSEPQIRFRNLLNISRLTIQFNINFCLFWDIFGTLFYTK